MSDDCKSMKLPGLLKNHFYFIHLPFNVTNFNQLGRFEGKTDDTLSLLYIADQVYLPTISTCTKQLL